MFSNSKQQINSVKGIKFDGRISHSSLVNYESSLKSNYYSIKYVVEGKEKYIIQNRKLCLNQQQFIIVKPNENVDVKIKESKPTKGVCIYIAPEIFEKFIHNPDTSKISIPNFPIHSAHLNLAAFFEKELIYKDSDTYLYECLQYFKNFFKSSHENLDLLKSKKAGTKMNLWENIERSRIFMLDNYDRKIKLHDIADSAFISPFHYQRVFKVLYKISPTQYLSHIRMQKAKQYLQTGAFTLDDIAVKCGFSDTKYFKKCFSKHIA